MRRRRQEAANEFDEMMKDVYGEGYGEGGIRRLQATMMIDDDEGGERMRTLRRANRTSRCGGTRRLDEDMDYDSVEQALRFMTMPPYTRMLWHLLQI